MNRPNSGNRDSLEFLTLPWEQALAAYGNTWISLVRNKQKNPTLLPGWQNIISETGNVSDPIQVLIIRQQDSVVAIVPYFVSSERHGGMDVKVAKLLTNVISYHASLITSIDTRVVLHDALEYLKPWDIFHIANIAESDPLDRVLADMDARIASRVMRLSAETSPYLPIEGDWESLIASKGKKFRYKLRQREKMLGDNAELRHLRCYAGTDVVRLVDEIIQVDANSWKAKHGLDIGARSHEARYYRALVPYLASLGALHADILYHSGTPIAYSLCCNWDGWFGQLKTSFDTAYSRFSPGGIVIDKSIQAAYEAGAREFDFLGDQDQHKLAWTSYTRRHADYFLYSRSLTARCLYVMRLLKRSLSPQNRKGATKAEATRAD